MRRSQNTTRGVKTGTSIIMAVRYFRLLFFGLYTRAPRHARSLSCAAAHLLSFSRRSAFALSSIYCLHSGLPASKRCPHTALSSQLLCLPLPSHREGPHRVLPRAKLTIAKKEKSTSMAVNTIPITFNITSSRSLCMVCGVWCEVEHGEYGTRVRGQI